MQTFKLFPLPVELMSRSRLKSSTLLRCKKIFTRNLFHLNFSVNLQVNLSWNFFSFPSSLIFSIFGVLVIASTTYDVIARQRHSVPHELYITFSAYTNGEKLFDITENKSPNAINCLNGLRALSVLWIIFGHRVLNQQSFPIANRMEVAMFYERFLVVFFTAHHLAVDTFFLLGGLLVTTSIMQAQANGRLNILRMVYRRYIRYTPVWAAIILFTVSIGKFAVTGPMVLDLASPCRRFWWAALLHIQNYVQPVGMCLNVSWYLSADFQLFIVSPLLVYPAIKYGWKYLWSVPFLGFLSSVYIFVMSLVFDIYMVPRGPGSYQIIITWIYFPTHARLGPWMIGITLGYILFKLRGKKVEMSGAVNAAMWITAFSVLSAIMAISFPMSNSYNNQTELLANAFFLAFHRIAWSIAVAWIVFACHHLKTGGFVKWFLELRQFQPLCRLGLSMYLVHILYQLTMMMNQKQVLFLDAAQLVKF